MRKSWLFLTIMTLLLRSNGALALVDIQGKDKIEVGSWGELKNAVADSGNAGKVIVLTGNITADVNNPIDAVGGAGIIIDGGGFTITGQEGYKNGQFINFDSKDKTDLIIQNVNFEGFGVVPTGGDYAWGGVIYNYGSLGDIEGNFDNSYASGSSDAEGGAIYNSGSGAKIGDITGDFSGNYVKGGRDAQGGAISNNSSGAIIGNITGDFSGNSVQGNFFAEGGAVYNSWGTIGNINGDFTGNYVRSEDGTAYGGAVSGYGGKIGNITGDFSGNYAKSENDYAYGGAIISREIFSVTMLNLKIAMHEAGRFIIIMQPSAILRGILRITMRNLKMILPLAGRFIIVVR